jgi:predicted esterase
MSAITREVTEVQLRDLVTTGVGLALAPRLRSTVTYLSVTLGLRRAEVSAVSEISGGIPVGYTVTDPHRVAVLISHGADDTLVPVQTAEDLRQYCLGHQMKVEINLYPGVGHYLPHAVEAKCIATTVEFFLNQLHSG